jgi:hypothetical protein
LKPPLQTTPSSRQDRWIEENREAIKTKIRRGIEQLDRGEGIPDNKLKAHLTKLKTKPE